MYDVRIPQVVRLDAVDKIGEIAEKYDSQLKKTSLNLWLLKVVAQSKARGPAAAFKEWSGARWDAGDCGPKDSQFCFLWLKSGADPGTEEAMRQLAHKYRTDPIKMLWASADLQPGLLEAFNLESVEEGGAFIAFRPKRSKFKLHEGPLKLAELDSFVDGVLNGGPLVEKVRKPPRPEL